MSKNGRELPSRERGPPFYVAVNHVAVNHVTPVRFRSLVAEIQMGYSKKHVTQIAFDSNQCDFGD